MNVCNVIIPLRKGEGHEVNLIKKGEIECFYVGVEFFFFFFQYLFRFQVRFSKGSLFYNPPYYPRSILLIKYKPHQHPYCAVVVTLVIDQFSLILALVN